jgi:hypothetical protein
VASPGSGRDRPDPGYTLRDPGPAPGAKPEAAGRPPGGGSRRRGPARGGPGYKEALARQTQGAIERGELGAPAFLVGEQLFVRNDRLDLVEEALRGAPEA